MRVSGVLLSLWRAAALFRAITLAVCIFLIARWHDLYAHPGVAYGTGAAMVAVTAVICWLAVTGRAHRPAIVGADAAVTVLLTLASIPAQTPYQRHGHMPTLTTIWAAGPVIDAAFVGAWLAGVLVAGVQLGAAIAVRAGYDGGTLTSGTLLIVTGGVVGYLTTLIVRAERDLAAAAATQAAVGERERLTRSIHDGVLQVLGLVHRAGRDASGSWAELGAAAGEQEAALRALLRSRPDSTRVGLLDLADELIALRQDRVTVSVPAEPIVVDAVTTQELSAAVREALTNVARHAGPDAGVWVLLERLDDRLCVTVRDDGAGMMPGRLDAAHREGRLGVAGSIRGRLAALGGTVTITSAPGAGTVVELVLPVDAR
ncbi:MAG TPA: ATP-binding protein [Jatrophihabitantaceae bacterium]